MSRILIADREAATVKALTKLLRDKEFEVEAAASGKELKQKLEAKTPDLIISDVQLPAVDGMRVAELVRRAAGNVPVLMLCTAGAESPEILDYATDFVMKPFKPEDVLTRVRKALAGPRAQRMIEIPNKHLHDPENGRINAQEVANFLGLKLSRLTEALGVKYPALYKTPSAEGLQEKLRPIKRSIDLVSRITLSQADARAWLNYPHPDLGGKAPIDVILGGHADAVVTMLENAFLGIPS